jgi:hypothetical protein
LTLVVCAAIPTIVTCMPIDPQFHFLVVFDNKHLLSQCVYSTVIQGTPLIWLSKVVLVEEELEVAAVEVEVEVDVAWKKR